ncbi:MAG: hypothetical protein ACT7A5_03320 [Ferrovibrionaceae bacterium]
MTATVAFAFNTPVLGRIKKKHTRRFHAGFNPDKWSLLVSFSSHAAVSAKKCLLLAAGVDRPLSTRLENENSSHSQRGNST